MWILIKSLKGFVESGCYKEYFLKREESEEIERKDKEIKGQCKRFWCEKL